MVGTRTASATRRSLTRREHLLTVGFGLWMVVGLFLDGWAHDNNQPESFFTPWHAVLYSGFVAAGATALLIAWRDRRPGTPWARTLPRGHGLTLAGLALFGAGGAGDLVWHELLGVEVGLEALLSPTHLLLLVGGLLALSAPFRAAWSEPVTDPESLRSFAPTVLTLAFLTAVFAFFMLYFSPFANDAAGTAFERVHGASHTHPSSDLGELQQLLGVASILMTTVLLVVPAHLLLRRWEPPAGTFTLFFGVVVTLLQASGEYAQPSMLLLGPLAGAATDRLLRRTAPVVGVAGGLMLLWLGYFALYALEEGAVAWTAELWTGTTVMAGLLTAGLALPALRAPVPPGTDGP
ncbi:MAG TPA: hypothetical protein VNU01_06375 [Egibacteraceae bacterium]|nr:hypothetical protein [Egibacteraceae bacterium]